MELGDYHRYLIPNYQNILTDINLSIWCVNPDESFQITGICFIIDNVLKNITFKSDKQISGRLEIKDSSGVTLFYSNCIEFLDSTDSVGRKFIRIATKHTYNRNLFDYQGNSNWIITSVPAYCLGLTSVDADVNNARTGGNSSLKTRETYLDEIVDYEFVSRGDANILNFLQVHSTNNYFFIDQTKRTSIDKIDRDEFSISGKLKFTNVKDKFGFNIGIDYDDILDDIFESIYSDEITYNFTYSHEPENDPNSGESFLTNLLFNNYHNPFGIEYNCDLKIKLQSIPVKGFIANNITRQIYSVGDLISYCIKDDLVYFPNGFNNDSGVQGNFTEYFSYRIVDQAGRIGKLTTHTLIMTDSSVEPIDLSVSITWNDDTSAPQSGNLGAVIVKLASLIFDPSDPVLTKQWEIFNGTDWLFYKDYTIEFASIPTSYLDNKIRFKAVTQFGVVAYSNILQYTKTNTSTIYITDEVITNPGVKTYKLHVEDFDFVGFENMQGEKNANTRNGIVNTNFGGVLSIPSMNDMGQYARKSTAVNLPIGVYDCIISVNGNPRSTSLDLYVGGVVSYGYTTSMNDGIAETQVDLYIEAT